MNEAYCFLNGGICLLKEAHLSVRELGLLRGYGVFDYLRTYGGIPFELPSYLQRFRNSAIQLGLPLNLTDEKLAEIIEELRYLNKNLYNEMAFKLVLCGGYSEDGFSPSGQPTFYILCEQVPEISPELIENGIRILTFEHQRFLPEVKTTSYLPSYYLQARLKEKRASDIIFHSEGQVRELTRCNVFFVKNGSLITPKEGILLGITRKIILQIAKAKFKVEERNVLLKEIGKMDEAFLSSSSKGILPVTHIDDITYNKGKRGKNTALLQELFEEYTSNISITQTLSESEKQTEENILPTEVF